MHEESTKHLVETVKKLPGIHDVADLGGDLIRIDIEQGVLVGALVLLSAVFYAPKEPPIVHPNPEDMNYCNCCCEYPVRNDYVNVITEPKECDEHE